jgi:NADH-quinone oxidoreductase subunit C
MLAGPMSVESLGEVVVGLVDGAVASVAFEQLTVDVPAERWADAARLVRDDERVSCDFFDWLSAYDDPDAADGAGALAVVLHAWSNRHRHHLLLRTHVPREGGRLPTATAVWAGAAWHERETFEMFGVVFDGHPNLVPLLLPDGFEGHPLRKDFVLASRVAKAWPGAKEPGESDHDVRGGGAAPGRRRMLPPGVPAPGEWGPASTQRGPEEGPA